MTHHDAFFHIGNLCARAYGLYGEVRHGASCVMPRRTHVSAPLRVTDGGPAQSCQHLSNSTLFGSSNFRGLDPQDVLGDIGYSDAREDHDMRGYGLLPRVAFEAIVLLRLDMFTLEFIVRPPFRAVAISSDGLGEKLVAIVAQ